MAGSARFEVDMALNASGVAKGANDAAMAFADLEEAVEGVADESARSGGKVDSFASKLIDAARKAGKSDDEIKDSLRNMGYSAKQAEDAIQDVGDEFRETGRDGKRAGDDLEDAMRDVQRQSERTERSVSDIGDAGEQGFRKFGDASSEASDELTQNLGETFSSFRGDLEDLPQIAQDVFGGLAGSASSLTMSLGLAGVAGAIGLAIAGFQKLQEQEEAREERIADWTSAYIGGLSTMEDALADFASVEAIYTDPERYKEAEKNAKNWGVTVSTAVNAMAGDMTSLNVVQGNLDENAAAVAAQLEKVGGNVRGLSHNWRELRNETSQGQEAFNELTGEMDEARARAAEYSESLLQIVQSAESAEKEVDELGNAVYTLPDGQQIMIDAETGQATTDLDKFEDDADGVVERLDGSEIELVIKTALQNAQNDINRFMSRNNGRTIRLHGRFDVSPAGTDWD